MSLVYTPINGNAGQATFSLPINLLDKITINEKTYIVMNKNIDLRNKVMKITVIGES